MSVELGKEINPAPSNASVASEAPTAVNQQQAVTGEGSAHPSPSSSDDGTTPPKPIERRSSVWGEELHVSEPLAPDDPKFLELRRTLSRHSTRRSEQEERFDLEQRLKSHMARSEDIKDKRLDVSWKGLAVRGVGADAVLADDMGS